jgi:hypothetical protein
LPGYQHHGEPLLISEFGGIALEGSGGWGYGDPANVHDLVDRYRDLVAALMAAGPVEGFCYTQLTDIEQERNGLLTFDRGTKVDPAVVLPLTQTAKGR